MDFSKKKSHARIESQPLETPNPIPDSTLQREYWLDTVCQGFVSPSAANKSYYRVVLELLWPAGHGIPGPIVSEAEIRQALDTARGKPYRDPFRRVRELQGEEGFLGIHKCGTKYQLVNLTVSKKKIPRIHLSKSNWNLVLGRYHNVCAVCGRSQSEDGFQQDHKIPRDRGGSDELENWQPLCDACNILKSTACRACKENCTQCCWAFPEKYKPLRLSGELTAQFRAYADSIQKDPDQLLSEIIQKELSHKLFCFNNKRNLFGALLLSFTEILTETFVDGHILKVPGHHSQFYVQFP